MGRRLAVTGAVLLALAILAFGVLVLYLRIDSGMPWYWWFR